MQTNYVNTPHQARAHHAHARHAAYILTPGKAATPTARTDDPLTIAMIMLGLMVVGGTVLFALVCTALIRYIRGGKGKGKHVST